MKLLQKILNYYKKPTYHKYNKPPYTLHIHAKQLSPWAIIDDNNSNTLYMFRPLKTDIATIQKANKFMKQKKLPLFDIKKYHIENKSSDYWGSYSYGYYYMAKKKNVPPLKIRNSKNKLYIPIRKTASFLVVG